MKKIYAALIAAIMTMQSFAVGVSAAGEYVYKTEFADYDAYWEMEYEQTLDQTDVFGCVTNEKVKTGEHAFLLRNNKEERKQIVLKQDATLPVGKTYTVSFAAYGGWGSWQSANRTFDWEGTNFNKVRFYCTKTTGGTDWKEVNIAWDSPKTPNTNGGAWNTFTLTFDTSTYSNISGIEAIGFVSQGYTRDLFIDDISVKDETGKEYIKNGGFEVDKNEIADEPDTEYDQSPYTPMNVMLTQGDGMVCLNWRNPSKKTLTEISVYDIIDGEEKLLSNEVDVTPSKFIFHTISGLSNGNYYQYKVVFTFSDKGDFVYYLGGTPALVKGTSFYLGTSTEGKDWKFTYASSSSLNYIPGEISIDNTVGHSGKSSLHYRSNIDFVGSTDMAWKMALQASNTIEEMEAGKSYQITFYGKAVNVDNEKRAEGTAAGPESHISYEKYEEANNIGHNMIYQLSSTTTSDDDGWVKITRTYECKDSGKNEFNLHLGRYAQDLWIDDVEVYELVDGAVPADAVNLCSDGGFENLVSETVGEITGLSATPAIGKITLNWTAPTDDCNEIEIYEKYYDNYLYRGTIAKNANSIELTNLKNGTEYTFRLIPVNGDGVKGKANDVTATVVLPDYEIGKVVLKKGKTATDKLSGAGDYSVSLPVKNNLSEDGMAVEAFVAVYDENNVLYKIFSTQKSIKKSSTSYTNVTTEFDVPGDNYTAEYFVFDSRTTLNIVGDPNPHTVFAD